MLRRVLERPAALRKIPRIAEKAEIDAANRAPIDVS